MEGVRFGLPHLKPCLPATREAAVQNAPRHLPPDHLDAFLHRAFILERRNLIGGAGELDELPLHGLLVSMLHRRELGIVLGAHGRQLKLELLRLRLQARTLTHQAHHLCHSLLFRDDVCPAVEGILKRRRLEPIGGLAEPAMGVHVRGIVRVPGRPPLREVAVLHAACELAR